MRPTVSTREKLTKRSIDALRAPESKYRIVWDTELRRFGIRVLPSGVKSFVIQYRNAYGRTRRKTVGQTPPLTVYQARELARQDLAAVARGIDPLEEQQELRAIPSVRELAQRYLSEHVDPHGKQKTQQEARRALDKHVIPAIGHLAVSEVQRSDLGKLHHRMRKTPVLANRVLKVAASMFGFAQRAGLLASDADNPARGITKYKEQKRDRHLSLEEYEKVGRAIDSLVESGKVSEVAADSIRVVALTGLRVGEVLALAWRDVDFRQGRATLQDSKTGPRPVVLNTAVLEVLDRRHRTCGAGEWVFPGRVRGQPLVNIAKPWGFIRAEAKLPDVRLHDLRHSFASVGVASQLGLPVIGALLGHRQPTTTARYAHLADDPLRKASDGIGSQIGAALRGARLADVAHLNR